MTADITTEPPEYPARCNNCGNLLILIEYLPSIEEKYYCPWCHIYQIFKQGP